MAVKDSMVFILNPPLLLVINLYLSFLRSPSDRSVARALTGNRVITLSRERPTLVPLIYFRVSRMEATISRMEATSNRQRWLEHKTNDPICSDFAQFFNSPFYIILKSWLGDMVYIETNRQ